MSKSICVVGAGPSGLVAAKTFLHNAPKGLFRVAVFDPQHDIGGLWPLSKTQDSKGRLHPRMVANQSKHTVQFSDLAWDVDAPQFPQAWMVGRYLARYFDTYLKNRADFELHLDSRIAKAERQADDSAGWRVQIRSEKTEAETTRTFDYLLVASGYFGSPIIPNCFEHPQTSVPIIHSSQYRDLASLLNGVSQRNGRKILVVGGQISGVETASTIASHLSSAVHSPIDSGLPSIEEYSVHHITQRPNWIFPLFITPEPTFSAPPFLPLDFTSYNLNSRTGLLINTQGHITEKSAANFHDLYEASLGNQSSFSSLLQPNEAERLQPPHLAASDWYCDFVRSGLITISTGKVAAIENDIATLTPGNLKIEGIAAVVLATGFNPSPSLGFLPTDILETLQHAAHHPKQPLALAFHGTHHPDAPQLGFVGFYRSPYWGIMEMQARFLARFWSDGKEETLAQVLANDDSISRTMGLRNDPRLSQFPMGDYLYLMQEFSRALSIEIHPALVPDLPTLSGNDLPLDVLTPARYAMIGDDDALARQETNTSLKATCDLTVEAFTSPRFVARAVFRSLLGPWRLERRLTSRLPSHPSGTFIGKAEFFLRQQTPDGRRTPANVNSDHDDDDDNEMNLEYLYIEDGEFQTEAGFGFRATRRYIWRYDAKADRISVWFAKTDDQKRADYLFHEIEFIQPDGEAHDRHEGWAAKAGHLCVNDYYGVKYNFAFHAVNLSRWTIEYTVNGPKKDYTIHGTYERIKT